jgi:hypothetical protein
MYYDMMSCFGVERLSDVGVGNLDVISKDMQLQGSEMESSHPFYLLLFSFVIP